VPRPFFIPFKIEKIFNAKLKLGVVLGMCSREYEATQMRVIRRIKSDIKNIEATLPAEELFESDDEEGPAFDPRLVVLYAQLEKERNHCRNLKLSPWSGPSFILPADPDSVICLF
jgi:hypothetical protein